MSICKRRIYFVPIGQLDEEHQYIENIYGYTDDRGEYYMVVEVAGSSTKDRGIEYSLVGMTGNNYGTTQELKILNYQDAMETVNKNKWLKAIRVKHKKMEKYNVFKTVHKDDVPVGTKVVD